MWAIQQRVAAFDADRFQSLGPGYVGLSLVGEAGELANTLKKVWRASVAIGRPDGYEALGDADRRRIADELADVVILSLVLANHLDLDIEEALAQKLQVIDHRLQQGYYQGEAKAPIDQGGASG